MRKRVRIVISLIALSVLGVIVWRGWPAGDPELRGKSFATWLDQYYENVTFRIAPDRIVRRQEAATAIQEMGTNIIPALLTRVRAKDSQIRKKLWVLMRKQSLVPLNFPNAESLRNRADLGFSILGPLGKPAIPELIALLQNEDAGIRGTAARCLGHIGPDAEFAIPAILPLLGERHKALNILAAMDALGEIQGKPEMVITAMVEFLQGSRADWNYDSPALNVLRRYGVQARSAVPAIEAYLGRVGADKRNNAESVLDKIDPAAAARAVKKAP